MTTETNPVRATSEARRVQLLEQRVRELDRQVTELESRTFVEGVGYLDGDPDAIVVHCHNCGNNKTVTRKEYEAHKGVVAKQNAARALAGEGEED